MNSDERFVINFLNKFKQPKENKMTREQEIELRLLATTHGKWKIVSDLPFYAIACDGVDITPSTNRLYRNRIGGTNCFGVEKNNAEFIANSKDDIGYLLEKVAILEMRLEGKI